VKFFLLVYDRLAGRLLEEREFDETQRTEASAERLVRESAQRSHSDIEVVLLEAESLEALRKTHSRYFGIPGGNAADSFPPNA
jgi:hypothetical protein